ncbi:unnamed protein product [Rotaria socialis]|uniref:GH18 domain-containing protein n=4 Tax=Rotaria socialis TaxID=392032 RepID=A0A821KEG1_9BILA|nr:unnamed protein product [Rotaria socialis]CAF3319695.1 unnamed protein product [Rotaria socialis]CAF3352426.1 unnamed protein product [Rotaria socialis]CAF3409289.1 unnamed protein product [Rotaria socialis]CAF3474445.1 unnamed protein product [Rotaria socialis]
MIPSIVHSDCGGEFKIVCYFSSWTGIHPEAKNCTHIVYTFARIEDDNTLTGVWNNPLKDFKSNKDPDLKVLLAVGGQDYAIKRANEMMSKDEYRQKFVISTTKLLRTHEFDGIDLNFEPSEALGPPSTSTPQLIEDRKKLSKLCKDLQEEYAEEAGRTGRSRLLLTVTISGIKKQLESRFDLQELAKCADWLNIQTYDYRGSRDKIAEHHSSLMQAINAESNEKDLNQDSAIKYIVNTGIEPSKLLVGLPAFGKKFRLTSDLHDLGSPATFVGSVPYTELCRNMMSGWQRVFLDDRKVPIMIKGDEVIGYDDLQSMELKINYAKEQRLSGIFIYPVNFDDSSGQSCNQGKFPIVSLVKRLTSNYTVSCVPLTTPPLNTTVAPKNRTKIITPKWKVPRPDYLPTGSGFTKHHPPRKPYNAGSLLTSMYASVCLHAICLFLLIV